MNNTKKLISSAFVAIVAIFTIATVSPYFSDVGVDEAIPMAAAALPQGEFVEVGDGIHDAEGMVKIIQIENGTEYLRLENFKSTNGPDLYVYLATDKTASEYIDFGQIERKYRKSEL